MKDVNNHYNALIEFVKRLGEHDEPIAKEDIFDELCFFIDKDKAYEIVYGMKENK